jgi:glycosyltransferase involved in cell wall biosynthesis
MVNTGIISTFLPTRCGIATYVADVIRSLGSISSQLKFTNIELLHPPYHSPNKNYIIRNNEAKDYLTASQYINESNINIVDIQHEFKIFGKPDGENISILLNHVKKPIITTLHTVFPSPSEQREKILFEIVKRSDILYVFSNAAKDHLADKYKKPTSKIEVIPHGVPSIEFKKPEQIPERKNIPASIVFVSAGHMRETKGYEIALNALHSLKKEIPGFQYFILGSNHPENETAQSYRQTLLKLIAELDLSDQIIFVSDYLEHEDFIKYIQLADIGLLPYTREGQSSSGVLSLMLASGRPVVSTPLHFATSQVTDLSGTLSDAFDISGFKEAIRALINKRHLWGELSQYNHALGQTWNWKNVAKQYIHGYRKLTGNSC